MKYDFIKRDAMRPTEEQRLLTNPFYHSANTVYARFDEWKDIDKFYFIPLYLEMTYCINGIVAEMAPDPVWLGSFVRCTLEHPELFQYQCPQCGQTVLPYRYVGSPLSGVVHLEGRCNCGWKGFESITGWRLRATALRDRIEGDKLRHTKCRILHPAFKAATINELLDYLKSVNFLPEQAAFRGLAPVEAAAEQEIADKPCNVLAGTQIIANFAGYD